MSRQPRAAQQRDIDALDLLSREHQGIRRHFRDYELLVSSGGDAEQKAAVVGRICDACCVHLQVKDELLYPAARSVLGSDPLLAHLRCDHAGSRELIARLDEMEPLDADFDVCVARLAACLLPHLDAERQELFPRLRCSTLALGGLGLQIAARRRALQADITRQSIPATMRWADGPAGGMRVRFSARCRPANSRSPVPCPAA